MTDFFPQGFSSPTALYSPNGIEGMLVDAPPHDFITPCLVNSGGYTAQVSTITIGTAATNTTYSVRIQGVYNDTDIIVNMTSDGDDTTADIATKVASALIANGVVYAIFAISSTSTTVVLTSRKIGTVNSYTVSVTGGAATVALTTAAGDPAIIPFGLVVATGTSDNARAGKLPTASTDVPRGVSVRTDAYESRDGINGILPGGTINTLADGRVWVKPTTAFKPTDPVYYSYASDTTKGTIRNSTATNHALLPGAKFENSGNIGDLAILKVKM